MELTEPAFKCKRVRSSSTWQHGTRAQLGTCQLTAHGAVLVHCAGSSMGSQLTGPQLGPSPMLPGTTASHPLAFECWLCQFHQAISTDSNPVI